jgi:hypothetical protein
MAMLLGNAAAGAAETGDWGWAIDELRAALDTEHGEERLTLLLFLVEFMADRGESVDAACDEIAAWFMAHLPDEPHLQSDVEGLRALRARAGRDYREAAVAFLASARLDQFGAPSKCAEAVFYALLERDAGLTREAIVGIDATGSHGAMIKLARRVGEAGVAALEGDRDAGRAGLVAAHARYRDLGAVRKQAMTGAVMATILGPTDPDVRAVIDDSRKILEGLEARLWLAQLDEVIPTGASGAKLGGDGAATESSAGTRHVVEPAVIAEP